jgi:hypothetical protein
MNDTRLDKPGRSEEAASNPVYQQMIRSWDMARDRGDFPHLASDVHWAFGRAHLTCFRSPDEWLTVFQLLTYSSGWGDFNILVYAYGNALSHQGIQDATASLRQQAAQQRGRLFYLIMRLLSLPLPPSDGEARLQEELAQHSLRVPPLADPSAEEQPPPDDDWCRDPFNVRILLRGQLLHLRLTQQDYDEAGVDLSAQVSGDGVLDRIIHVMRVLCHRLAPENLFYPPRVLLEYVARPPSLPLFLEIEDWCNPGLGAIDRPSDSPCLRSLAGALASNLPEEYSCPKELVNTHWSRWPRWLGAAAEGAP